MKERELVSQSKCVFPSCLSKPNGHWPLKAAWKKKLGLRYALPSLSLFSTVMLDVLVITIKLMMILKKFFEAIEMKKWTLLIYMTK